MNARRIDSLATATSPGSPSGSTRPSGIGSIHVASPRVVSVARSATCGSPKSIGRARRCLLPSMSRQTLVAMR